MSDIYEALEALTPDQVVKAALYLEQLPPDPNRIDWVVQAAKDHGCTPEEIWETARHAGLG